MRALFFGTPAIAVPSLDALTEIAEVVGVVCQPDRPAGRGLEKLNVPPVKQRALELGIEVMQPLKIRVPEFAAWVRSKDADVAIVIAYGRILPLEVLEAPRRGCLNLHASLLPKYRGAAPINWSIVRGEKETGVSLMQMDAGMDTGPVYTWTRVPIGSQATADDLTLELGAVAADVVRRDVVRVVEGALPAQPQSDNEATVAPILEKEHGRIDFTKPAQAVHDHVRGMTSWPGAFTVVPHNRRFVVLGSQLLLAAGVLAPPGTVVRADKSGVEVACGEGAIAILRGQIEGRKPLTAPELVAGRTLQKGLVLGASDPAPSD